MPDLDDPDYAAFAFDRFKRLLWWMALASALAAVAGLIVLRLMVGPLPWTMVIFSAGGIFFSVMLGAVLMGLIFLSSGSGHDEKIQDATHEDIR